jgi:LemA protein
MRMVLPPNGVHRWGRLAFPQGLLEASHDNNKPKGGTVELLIILGVIVLLVIVGVVMYNRLVQLRNRVEAGWSQIDVQLKRRYDLIPNLVETVKGYASHERQTLEAVVAARQQAVSAQGVEQQAQAENMLTGALRQLFAVSEAYPDLKANQNFLSLQEELTGTEGRIAYARQFYNDQVLHYDNAREQFPSSIFAGMFNFEEAKYFETEDAASRQPVRVDFGQGGGTAAAPQQQGAPGQTPQQQGAPGQTPPSR